MSHVPRHAVFTRPSDAERTISNKHGIHSASVTASTDRHPNFDEEIRRSALQLYETRRREDGHDLLIRAENTPLMAAAPSDSCRYLTLQYLRSITLRCP